jgi:hypothetical protein
MPFDVISAINDVNDFDSKIDFNDYFVNSKYCSFSLS